MCTRVLWNDNGVAVLTGRTMDWPESTQPRIYVLPRGQQRHGGMVGPVQLIADNPAIWTSKHASVVTTVYGVGGADGLNEKGLSAHLLYLTATSFGERDPSRPGLQAGLWAQYLLDQAATVGEALSVLDGVQLVMAEAHGRQATVHMAIEDAGGDSAIIEYIDGQKQVHHGPQYTIMTNDPTYDEQLRLLADLDFSQPSSDMHLPGNVNARDRFQRSAYYRALLPEPENDRQAVAGVLAIARNASVPFGAPYKDFGIYNTEYRTVTDVTNLRYFFELTDAPNVIWVELNSFDLAAGAPTNSLDPNDISLSGNVSDQFEVTEAPY